MSEGFVWRDAGRTVICRPGLAGEAVTVLAERGWDGFELLTTERVLGEDGETGAGARALAEAAAHVHRIPGGQVPELAADLLSAVEFRFASRNKTQPRPEGAGAGTPVVGPGRAALPPALVALGGGRVIDTAKAVAAVTGARVAALATTMSGAEMTAIHRLPAGAEERSRGQVRPRLVLADPAAMTSAPEAELRASSMNALGHGADSLTTPLSNPVASMTALRGAGAIAAALDQPRNERSAPTLALGSLLCGYALDSASLSLHHVVCQTLVRVCGSPHALTNAAILPHAGVFLARRAPTEYAALADALGSDGAGAPAAGDALVAGLESRLRELGGDPPGLGAAGAEEAKLDEAVAAMLERPELGHVPGPPVTEADLRALLAAAW